MPRCPPQQGHCNSITCMAVTEDRSTIITADVGSESMLVLWNSRNGVPLQSISQPHKLGIIAMDISPDDEWLATVGAVDPKSGEQEVGVTELDGCDKGVKATAPPSVQQHAPQIVQFESHCTCLCLVCWVTDRTVVLGHHSIQPQGEAVRAHSHSSGRCAALGALQHE